MFKRRLRGRPGDSSSSSDRLIQPSNEPCARPCAPFLEADTEEEVEEEPVENRNGQ
jgi:hypothetical protein